MLRWWSGAIAYVKKVDAPGGSIAIVDDGVHLILLHRMDGTIQQRPHWDGQSSHGSSILNACCSQKIEVIETLGFTSVLIAFNGVNFQLARSKRLYKGKQGAYPTDGKQDACPTLPHHFNLT